MSPPDGPVVEWGWAGTPLAGEAESGDVHAVAPFPGGVLIAVIDGLGHGSEAAHAAREAARRVEARAGAALDLIVQECHQALRGTRGVVMSLASVDGRASTLTWLAVGNVEAVLLRADPANGVREHAVPRGGVIGYQLAPLRPATIALATGDTLVMATDGIRSAFIDGLRATDSAPGLARSIHERHARGTDDALVLVARYLGGRP